MNNDNNNDNNKDNKNNNNDNNCNDDNHYNYFIIIIVDISIFHISVFFSFSIYYYFLGYLLRSDPRQESEWRPVYCVLKNAVWYVFKVSTYVTH